MYLSVENQDNAASIYRIYAFSERDEARHAKARLSLGILEQLADNTEINKISTSGLIIAPTCRLYYRELILTVKRPKQESIIIGIGAKHHRKPAKNGIHSLARVRLHGYESTFKIETDPLAMFLKEYLTHRESLLLSL